MTREYDELISHAHDRADLLDSVVGHSDASRVIRNLVRELEFMKRKVEVRDGIVAGVATALDDKDDTNLRERIEKTLTLQAALNMRHELARMRAKPVEFPDREHIVDVRDTRGLIEFLKQPNGSFRSGDRISFDATGAGVMVRTQPFDYVYPPRTPL